MRLKKIKYPQIMRTLLDIKYETLTVYFIIRASMPLQFKIYTPRFVITIFCTSNLTSIIRCSGTHGVVYSNTPNIARNPHK